MPSLLDLSDLALHAAHMIGGAMAWQGRLGRTRLPCHVRSCSSLPALCYPYRTWFRGGKVLEAGAGHSLDLSHVAPALRAVRAPPGTQRAGCARCRQRNN